MKAKQLDPDKLRLPKPPYPVNRCEPLLPWRCPKPSEEDSNAPARVQAILESPSYRRADADLDSLGRDSMRGVRLWIDYFKPELLFEEHRIRHTAVVFGITRICETAAAQRKMDMLKAALAADTGNKDLGRHLAIARRILAKNQYYEVAREFGRLVSATHQTANGQQRVVVTGGGPGIMEATNRGAFDLGAKSVGLNISLPHEQYSNSYITPDPCFNFHYLAMRKLHFLLRAKALVAFPGGYGTLDKVFEVLPLLQTRRIKPIPVVLVGESYWRQAVNLNFLVDEGVIDHEDRELFWHAETAEEIWNGILHWHDISGEPLQVA